MRRRTLPALVAIASLSALTACSSGGSDAAAESPPASSSTTSAAPSESSSSSSAKKAVDVVADPPSKSWEDAVEAARGSFDGEVNKIELEQAETGGLEYKVEQISTTQKYAVQYDASSLETLSEKTDELGDDAAEKQGEAFDPANLIDLDEAAKTARDEVDGTITEWKAEGKDTGKVIYEFDVLPKGASPGDEDREVQVDANDGTLVKDS